MSNLWLRVFKHLLPNARAWRLTVDKNLRRFFEGLSGVGADAKQFSDEQYINLDPQQTTELQKFESQFALPAAGLSEAARRNRLSAAWRALGGQDPRYIQDTLRAAGFDVYVHEWWEPIPGRPAGGSINGDATPVARDPFLYLDDGVTPREYTMSDGAESAQDGDAEAQDGGQVTPVGYPIVNKLLEGVTSIIGDGSQAMQDGGGQAQDGGSTVSYVRKKYVIPPGDPSIYPYFLYIGEAVFPGAAEVPESRRDEFEDLCLKICPLEQWVGLLVQYT